MGVFDKLEKWKEQLTDKIAEKAAEQAAKQSKAAAKLAAKKGAEAAVAAAKDAGRKLEEALFGEDEESEAAPESSAPSSEDARGIRRPRSPCRARSEPRPPRGPPMWIPDESAKYHPP